jgi:hypothetical protein
MAVCKDGSPSDGGPYPDGNDKGQYGWDVGFTFSSLSDLVNQVSGNFGVNQKIDRLAISAHGAPGELQLGGSQNFSDSTFANFAADFRRVAAVMNSSGVLLFMACNFGAGIFGANMLKRLSSEIFPGRTVVGFTTIGIASQAITVNCNPPGMKLTDSTAPSWTGVEYERRKVLVSGRPWANENSPQAKRALNGKLFGHNPDFLSIQGFLNGDWYAKTGAVSFIVHFDASGEALNGPCYWRPMNVQNERHSGTWAFDGKTLTFMFDDDAPDWQRLWHCPVNADENDGFNSFTLRGGVKAHGAERGQFEMSKGD